MREFELTEEDFRFLARQVYDLTGIVIHERKRDMLYSRLSRRLRIAEPGELSRLLRLCRRADGAAEIGAMINAVTTNLTHFFRESHHFDHLRDVALPAFAAAGRLSGKQKLRLWSAGCSSGEESYSIAMTVKSAPVDFSRCDRASSPPTSTPIWWRRAPPDAIGPPMPRASRPIRRRNTPMRRRPRPIRKSACATASSR